MIPFILCTYSSLTPSSKSWANAGIKISLSWFQSRRSIQSTEMSRLATTNLNFCPAPPFHGKIASFPSVRHTPAPLPRVFLRWLKCPPHSLFSCTASALLWLSQNLNQMTFPTGQLGPCWLTDQASSGYLCSSQLLYGDSHCQMALAVSELLQGSCP